MFFLSHTKFTSFIFAKIVSVVSSQWLSNTNWIMLLVLHLTVVNWLILADESSVAFQVSGWEIQKVIASWTRPRIFYPKFLLTLHSSCQIFWSIIWHDMIGDKTFLFPNIFIFSFRKNWKITFQNTTEVILNLNLSLPHWMQYFFNLYFVIISKQKDRKLSFK